MNFQPIIVTQLTVAAPFAKRNGGWPSNVKCTLMKAHFYLLFIFLTLMTSGLLVLPPLSVDVGTMKIIIPAQIQTDQLQIRNLSPQKIQIRESRRLRPQIKRISFIIFFFLVWGGKKKVKIPKQVFFGLVVFDSMPAGRCQFDAPKILELHFFVFNSLPRKVDVGHTKIP